MLLLDRLVMGCACFMFKQHINWGIWPVYHCPEHSLDTSGILPELRPEVAMYLVWSLTVLVLSDAGRRGPALAGHRVLYGIISNKLQAIYLFVCLSVYLSICLSVYWSIDLLIYMSIYVYMSICLWIYHLCTYVYIYITHLNAIWFMICATWYVTYVWIARYSIEIATYNISYMTCNIQSIIVTTIFDM